MKKRMMLLVLCAGLMAGCGIAENASTSVDSTTEVTQEEIDGFKKTEYEKYNSYASENGLGGDLIYVEGKVVSQLAMDDDEFPTLAIIIEQEDGNRWCISANTEDKLESIENKTIRAFGTYMGFSDLFSLPGISVFTDDLEKVDLARIEIKNNEEYETVFRFSDFMKDDILKNQESNNKNSSTSLKPNYSEEIPDEKENIIKNLEVISSETLEGDIAVFIKNNNDFVIPDLDVQVLFYKDGNITDTDEDGHDVLVPGNTVASKIDTPDDYDEYEVNVDVGWKYATSYKNWIYNIKVNSNIGDDGVIIQFENVGEVDIDELEYKVVFYKSGEIAEITYDNDITDFEAGSKIVEDVSAYGTSFDDYEIYINQAHTFGSSDGEIVGAELPENIGKKSIQTNETPEEVIEVEITEDQLEEEKEGKPVSENVNPEKDAHVTTMGERNAVRKAQEYLEIIAFSHKGMIEQLEFEGFTHEEAVYGADHCLANWKEQAAKKAKDYLDITSFSKEGIIGQLEFDGFTHEEAVYGAEQNGY